MLFVRERITDLQFGAALLPGLFLLHTHGTLYVNKCEYNKVALASIIVHLDLWTLFEPSKNMSWKEGPLSTFFQEVFRNHHPFPDRGKLFIDIKESEDNVLYLFPLVNTNFEMNIMSIVFGTEGNIFLRFAYHEHCIYYNSSA